MDKKNERQPAKRMARRRGKKNGIRETSEALKAVVAIAAAGLNLYKKARPIIHKFKSRKRKKK
jgi:hypothetical protein